MIARIIRLTLSLVTYFCVATCIAEALIVGYVAVAWQIDRAKMVRILAAAHGIDMADAEGDNDADRPAPEEQVSLEKIAQARAIHVRHLELREEAVRTALNQLAYERRQLAEKTSLYEQRKAAFEERLLALKQQAESEGTAELTSILEKIKADQAKQQIVQMLNDKELDEVVELLSGMQDSKRAKIIGEFKTPEESVKLAELLRRIRDGAAEGELAREIQEQLAPTPSIGP
jgi:hypothetical protein